MQTVMAVSRFKGGINDHGEGEEEEEDDDDYKRGLEYAEQVAAELEELMMEQNGNGSS